MPTSCCPTWRGRKAATWCPAEAPTSCAGSCTGRRGRTRRSSAEVPGRWRSAWPSGWACASSSWTGLMPGAARTTWIACALSWRGRPSMGRRPRLRATSGSLGAAALAARPMGLGRPQTQPPQTPQTQPPQPPLQTQPLPTCLPSPPQPRPPFPPTSRLRSTSLMRKACGARPTSGRRLPTRTSAATLTAARCRRRRARSRSTRRRPSDSPTRSSRKPANAFPRFLYMCRPPATRRRRPTIPPLPSPTT